MSEAPKTGNDGNLFFTAAAAAITSVGKVFALSNLFSLDEKVDAIQAIYNLDQNGSRNWNSIKGVIDKVREEHPSRGVLTNEFFKAAPDETLSIPVNDAIVKAKDGSVQVERTAKAPAPLAAKQVYASINAAFLDDTIRNEGLHLQILNADGSARSFENYTQNDWANTITGLIAAKEKGLLVKNEQELMQAINERPELEAVVEQAQQNWADFKTQTEEPSAGRLKKKPHDLTAARGVLDQLGTEPSVAASRAQIDKPVGMTLESYGIVSRNAFKLKGELQAELFALRLAHKEGKINYPKKRGGLLKKAEPTKNISLFGILEEAKADADGKSLEGDARIKAMRDFIHQRGEELVSDKTAIESYRNVGAFIIKGGFKYGGTGANHYELETDKGTIVIDFPEGDRDKNLSSPPIGVIAKATDGAGFYDAMTALQLVTVRGGLDGMQRQENGEPDTAQAAKLDKLNFQRKPFPDEPDEIKALWTISKKINDAEKDGKPLDLSPEEKEELIQGFEYALETLEAEAKGASDEMKAKIERLTTDMTRVGMYYAYKLGNDDFAQKLQPEGPEAHA